MHGDTSPVNLLHHEDHTLTFIPQQNLDALCAVEISSKELLLCFSAIGVYVDSQGRRSRQQELMWPAVPNSACESANERLWRLLRPATQQTRSTSVPCVSVLKNVSSLPPSLPGYNAPYLSVYSENAIDVFDVNNMEWIQTIPLKKVSAAALSGSLCWTH